MFVQKKNNSYKKKDEAKSIILHLHVQHRFVLTGSVEYVQCVGERRPAPPPALREQFEEHDAQRDVDEQYQEHQLLPREPVLKFHDNIGFSSSTPLISENKYMTDLQKEDSFLCG